MSTLSNNTKRYWTVRQLVVLTLSVMFVTWWLSPWRADGTNIPCSPVAKGSAYKSTNYTYRHADVWLYGDSITYQTQANLRASMPKRTVAVDAIWGRQSVTAVTALGQDVHRFPKDLPDTVVMATGTNDLYHLSEFARQVRLARAVLPHRVRLVWVNVYVDTTPLYNSADRIIAQTPGISIAYWSRTNLTHLGTNGRSIYLRDGIHVNDGGCVARNALIRQALR